jgi:hypothetical protein
MSKTKVVTTENQPEQAPPVSSAPAAQPDPGDEHHGRGGSYLRDPVTGERILVQRTTPCAGCQS